MKNTPNITTAHNSKATKQKVAALSVAVQTEAQVVPVHRIRQKRRINYAKKIMNDPFLFTV